MDSTQRYLFDWRIRGIPSDIWQRFSENIGELIQKEKLTAVDAGHLMTPNQVNFALSGQSVMMDMAVAGPTVKRSAISREIFDIRGGMKAPHLHYKGAVYMVNAAQWKKFTTLVVNDFRARLETAGSISFDQALDVAETAATLG